MSDQKAEIFKELAHSVQAGTAWLSPELRQQLSAPLGKLSKAELLMMFEESGIRNHPIAIEMARRIKRGVSDLNEPRSE